jgi:hypothetical protein
MKVSMTTSTWKHHSPEHEFQYGICLSGFLPGGFFENQATQADDSKRKSESFACQRTCDKVGENACGASSTFNRTHRKSVLCIFFCFQR